MIGKHINTPGQDGFELPRESVAKKDISVKKDLQFQHYPHHGAECQKDGGVDFLPDLGSGKDGGAEQEMLPLQDGQGFGGKTGPYARIQEVGDE